MFHVYPSESRHQVDLGWLQSRLSFSFGSYYDPNNTAFGVMRVCNDDVIGPGGGFGAHPHSDMEVVSIILEGAIRHEDNLGHREVIAAGEVQRMTAGTGVVHAEYNASTTEPLRILQLWFMPQERGLPPSYETCRYRPEELTERWVPVVTPEGGSHTARIHQDLRLYLGRLSKGEQRDFTQAEGRRMFLFVIEGKVQVQDTSLQAGDTVRIEEIPHLTIDAENEAFLMIIDLP